MTFAFILPRFDSMMVRTPRCFSQPNTTGDSLLNPECQTTKSQGRQEVKKHNSLLTLRHCASEIQFSIPLDDASPLHRGILQGTQEEALLMQRDSRRPSVKLGRYFHGGLG